ncbi:uncharacterized protein [Henckelia pumila]|uniref:uncharacterized protein n=1 Tax=Henckelia pumila TaxID=405737 RepID=UPI003C6E5DC5
MNFHEGGPSNFSFNAPSPPSDGEEQPSVMIKNEFHLIDQQQMVLSQLISATVAAEYFQESDNLQHGGSIPGHIVINRDRLAADQRLFADYFSKYSMYNESMFKRRFRMSRRLFLRIMESVEKHDNYFVQKVDGLGRPGLSPHQKITAALRILAYGTSADSTDEYIKIGRSGKPAIILEAVADYELWIWHAYFGLPGSNNDINVLSKSHLFANLANGVAPPANYVIQEK